MGSYSGSFIRQIVFINFIRKLGPHMDLEHFTGDPEPAIIVPRRNLTYDLNELTEALAAFPTPCTIERYHTSDTTPAGKQINGTYSYPNKKEENGLGF